MKKLVSFLYYFAIVLFPTSMLFRIQYWPGRNVLFALGLLGLLVYFTAKTIKDFLLKRIDRNIIHLQILIVLMSVILFSKYLYHFFGDYPGLLIVPIFIISSVFYLVNGKTKNNKLTFATITYLLLTIPLFGTNFHGAPREYFPQDWYNRYDVDKSVPITLPYSFLYRETEELSIKAFDLRKSRDFYYAILIYRQALKLEPQNPILLFYISECYARVNDLETAIAVLDTAIMIDSTYAGFYNNRGLLYYKLKENEKAIQDYQKAIELDSTQSTFYFNLALVYYYEDFFNMSCQQIEKAESLGIVINEYKELRRIKKRHCD